MREQIARLTSPKAWAVHDAILATFDTDLADPPVLSAPFLYRNLLRTLGVETAEAAKIFFRTAPIGVCGTLSMFQEDLQNSLVLADQILALTSETDAEWASIDTAPRDATIIEGRDAAGSVSRVRFMANFGGGRWCYVDPRGLHVGKASRIVSWRPLKTSV